MKAALLVFFGGGLGSMVRYATVLALSRWLPEARFPWGVFTANILGSFILGCLCALPVARDPGGSAWLLAATGFLGGYTTFSTLSANTLTLLQSGNTMLALCNAFGSLLLGVLAAAAGWWCARGVMA